MSIFKPIIPAFVLEEQVTQTLKTWFPTYLREIGDQLGVSDDSIPIPPRSYNVRGEADKWPEEQLPACVVISPGLAGDPERSGDGSIAAPYRIGVALFASSTKKTLVNRNVRWYAAAIRAILLQKRGLVNGLTSDVLWEAEAFDEGPTDGGRTFGTCITEFVFMVPDIVNRNGGPAVPIPPDPDELPGSDWPQVEETFVDVDADSVIGG